jgi:hypothetical protein
MTVKVKTEYVSSFTIPRQCVACGGTPGLKTKKVSGSTQSGRKKYTTLTLQLPLCDECSTVKGKPWYAVLLAVVGIPVSLVLGVAAGALAGQQLTTGLAAVVAIAVACVAIYITMQLSNMIAQTGMTPEQRNRRRVVRRAVRMSVSTPGLLGKGSILFRFENPAFATEFSQLNGGRIV